MFITDSQIHLWEAHRPDRPWPPEEVGRKTFIAAPGARPHREEPLGAEEMVGMMNAVGVARCVIVPPSPAGDSNDTALEAVARYPQCYGIMGRFDPSAPGARERLENWTGQPGMLGIRMTFHKPQWAPWLDNREIDWFWAGCERLGIPVMMLVPGRMDAVAAIARRFPGVSMLVDHMGRMSAGRDAACFADLDDMLALARLPNVSIKASAAPCYSTEPFPYRNLQPYLRRIFDAFGPRRTMWGSDVTRLPCTYAECLDHFLHHLDFLRGEDLEWVMGKAIAELLHWPEPASPIASLVAPHLTGIAE
jgi:predicted TIM-barrel fold metal-dependent hydrolase